MTRPRVLLVGYYGKGNFGDDVLLTVSYRLLQQAMPGAHISIVIDGHDGGYVARMLPGATSLPPGRHGHFDRIVHGGGGVFFDFASYGWWRRAIEQAVRFVGFKSFLTLEKMLRSITGKLRTSADRRIGLGIGVGGFSSGSPNLLLKLPILADFAALWLRDAQSVEQLQPFQSVMPAQRIAGSDLAFLSDHWLPATQLQKPTAARPRLGIALRDWPADRGGITPNELSATLAQLAQHYDITGFIFDQHSDPELTALLDPYTTHVWQPETMTIAQFATLLQAQDVLLTSRAHGAICAACLGVPSVIVAIEPKLEQIHAMLPHASILVAPNPQHWQHAIAQACSIAPAIIAADVAKNRAASEAAFTEIKRWLV